MLETNSRRLLMKSIIKSINTIWCLETPSYHEISCLSPSGHTLHYIISGSYTIVFDKTEHLVKEGDIIYYRGNEYHRYIGNSEEVSFYSINFDAPELIPVPISSRIIHDKQYLKSYFADAKNALIEDSIRSNFEAFIALESICMDIFREDYKREINEVSLWKEIEIHMKKNSNYKITIKSLADLFGVSTITLYRKCMDERGGMSPSQFIRLIRLDEAKKTHSTYIP